MGFFNQILDMISSLFGGNSPEAQQKADLRHLEASLKQYQPSIYRNRMLLPNFAEAFRILDLHTVPIGELLADTICSPDTKRSQHFIDILIETGFSAKAAECRQHLQYNVRKEVFLEQSNAQRTLELQRQEMNQILRELNTPSFHAIERSLQTLDQLNELCRFQYPLLLKQFNPDYTDAESASSSRFEPVEVERLDSMLLDFYFLCGNFTLTATEGRALEAVLFKKKGAQLTQREIGDLQLHLRKISSVLTQILKPAVILDIIRIAKNDPRYQGKIALSQKRFLEQYAAKFKTQFDNDTQRLTSEIQDERITTEINELFSGIPLIELNGYTQNNSTNFRTAGSGSFLWILPLQIIKTFTKVYIDQRVTTFLNDVVVEGYFNNPQFKSEFSEAVFAALDVSNLIMAFEKSFEKGEKNDLAVMEGYIRDSSTDPSFMKMLDKMIEDVNTQAKKLIQSSVTTLHTLYTHLSNVLPDSKKSSPEIITNIKGFFTSSRNHDNAAFLESSFSQWDIFMDVMRNYAIIGEVREEK